jgi:hypothetical protein
MSAESRGSQGEVFLDARGNGRALRLTWHHEVDLVVLSLWREDFCVGTFRLSAEDVNAFIDALVDGIRDAPGTQTPQTAEGETLPPAQRSVDTDEPAPLFGDGRIEPTASSTSEPFTDWAFGEETPRATA